MRPDTNFPCNVVSTLGQLNFFRWAISNNIINYIEDNFDEIEKDMNQRNTTSKKRKFVVPNESDSSAANSVISTPLNSSEGNVVADGDSSLQSIAKNRTRKKREELSECACKSVKKENMAVIIRFT
jgi:hypothetical protein